MITITLDAHRGKDQLNLLALPPKKRQRLVWRAANEMKKLAREEGHRFLRDDGLLKAWQGLTTVEEVLRVAGS